MELSQLASFETGLDSSRLFKAVWDREQIMGTALGSGIAVRGGYRTGTGLDFSDGFSGGLGYTTDTYQVDYA